MVNDLPTVSIGDSGSGYSFGSSSLLESPKFANVPRHPPTASKVAICAVLAQSYPEGERVISYFSKILNPAEHNYDPTNREGLAVVRSIDHLSHYLEFDSFNLFTDHSALRTLQTFRNSTRRIARWTLFLQQFTFTLKHRPGKLHVSADAMTRPPVVHRDLVATYPTVDTPISSDASPIFLLLSTTTAVNTDDFSTQHLPAAASDLPESLVDRIRREQRNDPDILILIRYLEDGSLPSDQRAAARTVGRCIALKIVNGIVYHRQFICQLPGFFRLQLFAPLSMRPDDMAAYVSPVTFALVATTPLSTSTTSNSIASLLLSLQL